MTLSGHVVCAVDFGDTSQDALALAHRLACLHAAHLHLLRVVRHPLRQPLLSATPGVDVAELLRSWIEGAERQLDALAAALSSPDPLLITTVVVIGTPADEIARYAEDYDADLIVIGSHRTGLLYRLLGGIADRVIRQASCPMLVVPSWPPEGDAAPVRSANNAREIHR